MVRLLESVGYWVLDLLEYVGGLCFLCADTITSFLTAGFRTALTLRQMAYLGVNSLLIVLLTTTFAGMVISLQLAHVAVTYGVANIVGGGVVLAMTRELGPMLTAVVVAGRAGSAIAAEIGSMKVTEQIDALICLAVSPTRYLVVPRMVGLTVMVPVLTLFSVIAGSMGGSFVADVSAGIPQEAFYDSVHRLVVAQDLYKGLFKAAIYGFQIALVACYEGLATEHGAAGVGHATTKAVVSSMIIIFITNYILSAWLFPVT